MSEWAARERAGSCSPCGRGVVRRGGECPAAAGFSLLCCLVFVALRVPASSRGVRPGRERGGGAGCLRQRCGSALCVCERVVVGRVPLRPWVGVSFCAPPVCRVAWF